MKLFKRIMIVLAVCFMILTQGTAAKSASYRDGVYEGEYSFVRVRVYIREGNITDIEMLHHGGGGEKYAVMVKPLFLKIIESQSTDVDGVTGATVSSDHLKKAVENALRQAVQVDQDS